MYLPAAFAETDQRRLHDFIEQYSFGLLVSRDAGQPFATHLPLLLDRQSGPQGCLMGHTARANPQVAQADGQTVLAVFSGPHTYISPTWYEAEPAVPTWNYVAVHAYGKLQIIEDVELLRELVARTVRLYEQSMPRPWSFDSSTQYATRMLGQIIGFRIQIERIDGKWKLNQNQPVERRTKVIYRLQEQGDENALAIAALMDERISKAMQ
jgi:transcriptional regulator